MARKQQSLNLRSPSAYLCLEVLPEQYNTLEGRLFPIPQDSMQLVISFAEGQYLLGENPTPEQSMTALQESIRSLSEFQCVRGSATGSRNDGSLAHSANAQILRDTVSEKASDLLRDLPRLLSISDAPSKSSVTEVQEALQRMLSTLRGVGNQ